MLFSCLSTLDVLMLALHVLPHCSGSTCSIIHFLRFFFQFGTKTRQIKIYLHLKNLLHRLTGYVIRIKWRTIIFVSHVAVLRCSWRWFNTYYVLRLKSGGKPDHQTLTYDSAASINLPGRYFDRNELLEIHQSDDWYVKLKVQHRLDEQGLRSFR